MSLGPGLQGASSLAFWGNNYAIPSPDMLQNTLFRKQSWGLTRNSEDVHEAVLVTASGLRHWPFGSVTANKWVNPLPLDPSFHSEHLT